MKKSRRQFLQHSSAAAASFGIIGCQQPGIAGASSPPSPAPQSPAHQIPGHPSPKTCIQTTRDAFGEGPFYTQNPPALKNAVLAAAQEPGARMIIRGRLFNLDCSRVLPHTVIDVWHANAAGQYDNAGYNLRGQTLTDDQGFYSFETIKPGKYLNGARFRPAHIHFKITPPGFQTLTTQLYFEGDPDLSTDMATTTDRPGFEARERIIALTPALDGKLEGIFNMVVKGAGRAKG